MSHRRRPYRALVTPGPICKNASDDGTLLRISRLLTVTAVVLIASASAGLAFGG